MLSLNDISDVKAITFFSREQRPLLNRARDTRKISLPIYSVTRNCLSSESNRKSFEKSTKQSLCYMVMRRERASKRETELQERRKASSPSPRMQRGKWDNFSQSTLLLRSINPSISPIQSSSSFSRWASSSKSERDREKVFSAQHRALIRTTAESPVYYRIKIRSVPTARGVLRNTEILQRVKANNEAILFPFPFHHHWDFAAKKGKKKEQIVSNEMEDVRTSKIRLPLQYEWFQSHWSS